MELLQYVDAYCERLAPGLWDEPLNAVTNLCFLLAAAVMWRRCEGDRLARGLCGILALIGISSGAWHMLAQAWAGAADSLSILGFILVYLYGANRRFLGLGHMAALGGVALFVPYAAATGYLFSRIGWLGSSAGYAPVALLILLYAIWLWRRAPATARGLAIGAGILILSLSFRTLDAPVCAAWPAGTHFLWHVLNAIMLGWMIETYRRAEI